MSTRAASWLAWSAWAFCVALAVLAILLDFYTPPTKNDPNFHEKAHSVKGDVASPLVLERNDPVSFAMLSSALLVSPLIGDSVHRMRSVLIRTNRRCCNLRSALSSLGNLVATFL
jgi:hypothetical protein